MKRKLILISIATFFLLTIVVGGSLALNGYFGGGSGSEVLSTATSTQGLVGYWDFSEGTGQTANDSSDSNNDGTRGASSAVGTDDPTWTTGKAGNGGALNFDGSNDIVTFGTNIISTCPCTYSFWIRTSASSQGTIFTNMKDGGVANGLEFMILADGTLRLRYYSSNVLRLDITTSQTVNNDTWRHILFSWDGATTTSGAKVYIDGLNTNSGTSTASDAGTRQGNDIVGAQEQNLGGYNKFFNGTIDEPRIYNRALSASEIRYLYNRGGPVAHYKFDEGSGTTAFDATNITNDGTITGATYTTGKFGTALNFDGTDDVVTVTNANPIDFDVGLISGVTFSSWIRADNAGEGTGGQIIWKGTNTWVRVDTLSSGRLDLEASLDLATTDATLNTSQTITQSTWHHVMMTYTDDSDDEIELYVDGILVGTSTNGDGAPAATDTNNLLIAGTTTNNFDGLIDDFRVFGYARSGDEIKADYNAGLSTHFR